jgi:hypothetical protein
MDSKNLQKASELHDRRVKLNKAMDAVKLVIDNDGKDEDGDIIVGDINNFDFVEYDSEYDLLLKGCDVSMKIELLQEVEKL